MEQQVNNQHSMVSASVPALASLTGGLYPVRVINLASLRLQERAGTLLLCSVALVLHKFNILMGFEMISIFFYGLTNGFFIRKFS